MNTKPLYELVIIYERGYSDVITFEATSLEDAVDQIIDWLPESRDAYQMRLIERAHICEFFAHRLDSPEKTGSLVAHVNMRYFAGQNDTNDYRSDRDLWVDGNTLDGSPVMAMEGVA